MEQEVTLNAYIMEHKKALKELCVWKYMTLEEKSNFKSATTTEHIDKQMRIMREKYLDYAIEQYEKEEEENERKKNEKINLVYDENELVRDSGISDYTKRTLLKNRIRDKEMLVFYIKAIGWKGIKLLSENKAREVFSWILNTDDMEMLDKCVIDYANGEIKNN